MSAPPSRGHPELARRIRDEIRDRGAITFARFMEQALYDPDHGYYTSGSARIGTRGDFFTASDVGTLFGECVATQLREMDTILGRPDPFSAIEFGAGRGLLAQDIVRSITADRREPDGLHTRLRYVPVDRSPGMRAAAVDRAPEAPAVAPDAVAGGMTGCVLAVELFDALPVHRVRRRKGRLREVRIDVGAGEEFIEIETTPSDEVAAAAARYGAASREGHEAEVCLALKPQIERMTAALHRGFLLVVDYGHEADELYSAHRARGTLLAYHRHTTDEQVLDRVGEQDLTAHVNLTALRDAAAAHGWSFLGATTQDRFLIANGILARFEARDDREWRDPAQVRERLRAMQLIHPQGMGRTFKVLAFARGIDPTPDLLGLRDPFAGQTPGGRLYSDGSPDPRAGAEPDPQRRNRE